jgi:hypothetical protein
MTSFTSALDGVRIPQMVLTTENCFRHVFLGLLSALLPYSTLEYSALAGRHERV